MDKKFLRSSVDVKQVSLIFSLISIGYSKTFATFFFFPFSLDSILKTGAG